MSTSIIPAEAAAAGSRRISPTAHYTAYVWHRHNLSHPALTTTFGQSLYYTLRLGNMLHAALSGRPDLDMMLLGRHVVLDELLKRDIESGRISQVIEIAAGLSPRGITFASRYPQLRYIEADLPEMAAHKRARLDAAGLRGANHEVLPIDALTDEGPLSLSELARRCDATRGTAIITEGLLNYFSRPLVESLWARIARVLSGFPEGVYYTDLNVDSDLRGVALVRVFRSLLSIFARGRVHIHWDSPEAAVGSLRQAGFDMAAPHSPQEFVQLGAPGMERETLVRVFEARTHAAR